MKDSTRRREFVLTFLAHWLVVGCCASAAAISLGADSLRRLEIDSNTLDEWESMARMDVDLTGDGSNDVALAVVGLGHFGPWYAYSFDLGQACFLGSFLAEPGATYFDASSRTLVVSGRLPPGTIAFEVLRFSLQEVETVERVFWEENREPVTPSETSVSSKAKAWKASLENRQGEFRRRGFVATTMSRDRVDAARKGAPEDWTWLEPPELPAPELARARAEMLVHPLFADEPGLVRPEIPTCRSLANAHR